MISFIYYFEISKEEEYEISLTYSMSGEIIHTYKVLSEILQINCGNFMFLYDANKTGCC